jgi:hypothetical protein
MDGALAWVARAADRRVPAAVLGGGRDGDERDVIAPVRAGFSRELQTRSGALRAREKDDAADVPVEPGRRVKASGRDSKQVRSPCQKRVTMARLVADRGNTRRLFHRDDVPRASEYSYLPLHGLIVRDFDHVSDPHGLVLAARSPAAHEDPTVGYRVLVRARPREHGVQGESVRGADDPAHEGLTDSVRVRPQPLDGAPIAVDPNDVAAMDGLSRSCHVDDGGHAELAGHDGGVR